MPGKKYEIMFERPLKFFQNLKSRNAPIFIEKQCLAAILIFSNSSAYFSPAEIIDNLK